MSGLRKLLFFLFVLTSVSINEVQGQTVCSQTLASAQENFDQGHFYGIPSLLKDCIDGGFSKDQKIEAYKLLTITYLYIDDPIGAENSYLELLKLDPEHKVDPAIDPIEIIYLNEKFTTTPYFTIQLIKLGVNGTRPFVINNYGADNTNQSNEKYKTGFGFTFGLGADYNLSDYFSIGLEGSFERKSYQWNNIIFGQDPQQYQENITGISIPIFLRATYPTKKWYPYAYGGYALKINLRSSFVNINFNNNSITQDGSLANEPVVVPDIANANRLRKTLNTALVAGLGVKYRLNYEYLSFDIRMDAGLLNHQKESERYLLKNEKLNDLQEPSSMATTLAIVMDDIRLSSLTFTVGYVKPLYKPRKKISKVKGIRGLFKRN